MSWHLTRLLSVLVAIIVARRCEAEFSSKTPYAYYRSKEYNLDSQQVYQFSRFDFPADELSSCTPVNLNVLFRHGTRNPSDDSLQLAREIVAAVTSHADELHATANGFDPRTLTAPPGEARALTAVAPQEFEYLSKYVSALLNSASCDSIALQTRSSSVERSFESAKLMLANLCNGTNVSQTILVDDLNMRFFDYCDRYIKEVDDNDTATEDVDLFESMPDFLQVIASANQTFAESGFQFKAWLGKDLDRDYVQMFYELCALDVGNDRASLPTNPGWCALIRDQFKVIDYAFDMKYYYKNAHAYPINYQSACGLFDFILDLLQFSGATDNATLMFGHLETVMPFVTLLDLVNRNESLTSENYQYLAPKRDFLVERMSPFAGNIALRTMQCGTEKRVYFMFDERLVRPYYCSNNNYCTLAEVQNYYATACPKSFDEICAVPSPSNSATSSSAHVAWIFALVGCVALFVRNFN